MLEFEHPQLRAGLRYHKQGNWTAARSCYLLALHEEPLNARYLLGELAYAQAQYDEAQRYLNRVLQMAPEHGHALLLMGNMALLNEDAVKAERYIQQALKALPELYGAYLSLARVYHHQSKLQEALSAYQNYTQYFPRDPRVWWGKLRIWEKIHHVMRQIQCLEQLNQITPWDVEISEKFIRVWPFCCQLESADRLLTQIEQRTPSWWQTLTGKQQQNYLDKSHQWQAQRLYLDYLNPEVQDTELLKHLPQASPPTTRSFSPAQRSPNLRRIAYFSHHFGPYSTSKILEPLLQNHSERFELYAYNNGSLPNPTRDRLAQYFHHWREVGSNSDHEIAAHLHHDGIQILVDMDGFSSTERYGLWEQQAVPIQVTGPGFLFSGAHPFAQYCFSDPSLCPPDIAKHYPETPCYLNVALHFQTPPEYKPVRKNPQQLVLGSANSPHKFNRAVIELWVKILLTLPQSQLFLKSTFFDDPELKNYFLHLFQAQGIPLERLRIEGSRNNNSQSHLAYFHEQIDIALDPFPYQGGITSVEALWMGVPVVILNNPNWRARALGVSLYQHLGLQDWLADSPQSYLQTVLDWAAQPEFLAEQRQSLRARLKASDIFNHRAYTQEVEAYYEQMWSQYLSQTQA